MHKRLLALSFLLPALAVAKIPQPVADLAAEYVDHQVVVHWTQPDEVDGCNVYYNSESLVETNDFYDFETVEGTESEYTFEDLPGFPLLYISVLCFSGNDEANTFTDETSVSLVPTEEPRDLPSQAGQQPHTTNVKIADPLPTETVRQEPFALLSAESMSSLQVIVTFSTPPSITAADPYTAVSISQQNGTELPILGIAIQDKSIIVSTDVQQPKAVYTLAVSDTVKSSSGKSLDADERSVFFVGFNAPLEQTEENDSAEEIEDDRIEDVKMHDSQTDEMEMQDDGEIDEQSNEEESTLQYTTQVQDLYMEAQAQTSGEYAVTATWAASDAHAASYVLQQSRDRGKTFGPEQRIPLGKAGITIDNVPPGEIGLLVRVERPDGSLSDGAFKSLFLPPVFTSKIGAVVASPERQHARSVLSGSVSATTSTLAVSGGGIALMSSLMAMGGVVGMRRMRRKV